MLRRSIGLLGALVLVAGHAAAQNAPPMPDFDGDGRTDFLFANTIDSTMEVWLMDGIVRDGSPIIPVPPGPVHTNWKVACVADYNAQSWPDILWRNASSGELVVWTMRWEDSPPGTRRYEKIRGDFLVPRPQDAGMISDPNWQIVACPDIGSMAPGAGTPNPEPDNKVDIVWQHQLTREIRLWYVVNFNETNSITTSPAAPADANWKLIAARDFGTSPADSASDNRVDLVFQNTTSKKTVVWFMNGHEKTGGGFTNPAEPVDLNWDVTAVGDLGTSSTNPALDGKADIIFRNANSGNLVVWFMNGLNRTEGLFTTPLGEPDLDKVLIAPR